MLHPPKAAASGLAWRAVVHPLEGGGAHTAWHLAACSDPGSAAAHCPEGQRLLEAANDPDGHCLIGERCGRCGAEPSPPPPATT